MSTRKHRNTHDRRLVLATFTPDADLYGRPDTVRAHFDWRIKKTGPPHRGQRRGNTLAKRFRPYHDSMGRTAWNLFCETFLWLVKNGYLRVRTDARRNDRDDRGRKSSARTHSYVRLTSPQPQPAPRRKSSKRQSRPASNPARR